MNIALVFAGGSGSRMHAKGTPKQFLEVNGVPIIIRTIEHFEQHEDIDAICVVCIEPWISHLKKMLRRFDITKVKCIVPGGKDGQESIRNGLYAIKENITCEDHTIVLIHDGVRPLIDEQLISDNIACVKKKGNAITVIPEYETIAKVNSDHEVISVEDRSQYYIARAPQSFYLKDIIYAHEQAVKDGISSQMTDSAMLMSHYGFKLNTVEGSRENIKVTTPMDYYICRALLQAEENSQIWGMS